VWQVSSVTPAGQAATSYAYDTAGRVARIAGPAPAGVSCTVAPLTTPGCRSLTLNYATSSSTQADDPTGLQDYTGRLVSIVFAAADPATGQMPATPTLLTRYGCDTSGRLAGVWHRGWPSR
jgi:YD repeat-containing protein